MRRYGNASSLGFTGARLSYPLWYWINDGLMTIFFFVIGLEIKRESICGESCEIAATSCCPS